METEYPPYFYKYHSLENGKNLEDDNVLKALFNFSARFSNRNSFNDLFDSKIDFIEPSELKMQRITKKFNKKWGITDTKALQKLKKATDDLLDRYWFYCISANGKNNLMWSHYADSHKGFCIEFNSKYIKANKVTYQKELPQIQLTEIFDELNRTRTEEPLEDENHLGKKIIYALCTKLDEWAYEDEYRIQLNNEDTLKYEAKRITKENYLDVNFGPHFIESIIFGCRTPIATRKFIIEKMKPHKVKFKEAFPEKCSINIRDITNL
jgi:hypothetical protein